MLSALISFCLLVESIILSSPSPSLVALVYVEIDVVHARKSENTISKGRDSLSSTLLRPQVLFACSTV